MRWLGAERGHGGGRTCLDLLGCCCSACYYVCPRACCALLIPLPCLWRDLDLFGFCTLCGTLPACDHVVGVAFAGSLIRLRLLLFIDDLALFYSPRAQQSVAQVCLAGLSWARQPTSEHKSCCGFSGPHKG